MNEAWLDIVKAYGNSPIRFIERIMKNTAVRVEVQGAVLFLVFWNRSLMISNWIFFHKYWIRPLNSFVWNIKRSQDIATSLDISCRGIQAIRSGENCPKSLFIIVILLIVWALLRVLLPD